MGEDIDIVGGSPKPSWIKISYSGVYNFDNLYRNIISWFKKNNYFFHEKTHIESVKPNFKDYKYDFTGIRQVDEYVSYSINVEIWALRTKEIDAKDDAVKLVKGEIQLRIKGSMTLDYRNSFDKYGKLGKVLRSFYHTYIIRKRIWTKYAGDIFNESNDLINSIKSSLNLITP